MSDASDTPATAKTTDGSDVVIVTTRKVSCIGSGGALGHPISYMEMGDDNRVRCKYCDRIFAMDPNAAPDDGH